MALVHFVALEKKVILIAHDPAPLEIAPKHKPVTENITTDRIDLKFLLLLSCKLFRLLKRKVRKMAKRHIDDSAILREP